MNLWHVFALDTTLALLFALDTTPSFSVLLFNAGIAVVILYMYLVT